MADEKADGQTLSAIAEIAKAFGLAGFLLVLGFAIVGLVIFKGPDFVDHQTQAEVVIGGGIFALIAIVTGFLLLRSRQGSKSESTVPAGGKSEATDSDVFIAAPMAGYHTDERGRTSMKELVGKVAAALERLGNVKVYTPLATRPEAKQFEDPTVGFEVELKALCGARRYLLILPQEIPPATSVLVTAGMAIALDIPAVVLVPKESTLPYMLEGAAGSKTVRVSVHRYKDASDIENWIGNNQLRIFPNQNDHSPNESGRG